MAGISILLIVNVLPIEAVLGSYSFANRNRWYLSLGLLLLAALMTISFVEMRKRKRSESLRREVENKAQEAEKRFETAVDRSPVMIWMSERDSRCTFVNRGWLAFRGRTLDEELGHGWAEGIYPDDKEHCLSVLSSSYAERRNFQMEYRMRSSDGQYHWIFDQGLPKYGPHGTFEGFVGSCIDITRWKQSEEELKGLNLMLLNAQESERRQIARELHDDFCQQMTILCLELDQLTWHSGNQIKLMVRDLETRIRNLSRAMNNRAHQLHSSHLEILGLPAAIHDACNEFSEQHPIKVKIQRASVPSGISSDISLCLFRVLQECLENVARHSHSRECWVDLVTQDNNVVLSVTDAGIGFDPATRSHSGSFGLLLMRERLRLVGGNLTLTSRPGGGTRVEARVPLQNTIAMTA